MLNKALSAVSRRVSTPSPAPAKSSLLRQLVYEVEQGRAEALSSLLDEAPAGAVDWADAHGFTLLMHACTEGHGEVVQVLLDAGATLDLTNPQQETALHLASSIGYTDVVHLLVEHGADPSLQTASGVTASDLAAQLGHEALAAFLGAGSAAAKRPGRSGLESLAVSSSAPADEDARDVAHKLLDADLSQLSSEALDEVEAILQILQEQITALRTAAAAPSAAAPATAPGSSTKNTAALARARASGTPPQARPPEALAVAEKGGLDTGSRTAAAGLLRVTSGGSG